MSSNNAIYKSRTLRAPVYIDTYSFLMFSIFLVNTVVKQTKTDLKEFPSVFFFVKQKKMKI